MNIITLDEKIKVCFCRHPNGEISLRLSGCGNIVPNHYSILAEKEISIELGAHVANWPDCSYTRTILPDGRLAPEIYPLDDLRWIMEE